MGRRWEMEETDSKIESTRGEISRHEVEMDFWKMERMSL